MNQLFINRRTIPKSMRLINNIDAYFDSLILTDSITFNEVDIKFLKIIDKSELSTDRGYINTPFGNHVPIFNMSTGMKTLILVNHVKENMVVDISQCGGNVLNILFNEIDNRKYYTSFCILPDTLKIPVKINNRKELCKSISELLKVWEDKYDL